MKPIILIAWSLLVSAACFAGETNVVGSIFTYTIPDDMTFEARKSNICTFQWVTGKNRGLLVLSSSSTSLSVKALKAQAAKTAVGLEAQHKKSGHFTEIDKRTTEIELGVFKGTELEMILKHGSSAAVRQYMYYLTDGTRGLQGQLICHHPEDQETAHAIIRSAKRLAK